MDFITERYWNCLNWKKTICPRINAKEREKKKKTVDGFSLSRLFAGKILKKTEPCRRRITNYESPVFLPTDPSTGPAEKAACAKCRRSFRS
jgi:hypothetical protein